MLIETAKLKSNILGTEGTYFANGYWFLMQV